MILRRVIAHFRKQEWTAIGLDFVIVVVGVFVGLQVSNWNDARTDSRREASYIAALIEDFGSVIAELESDIARYEEIANAMTLLLVESQKEIPDASLDELNEAAAMLIAMEGTPIVSDTYTNLTGSGDLAIIKRQDLKNALSSFFRQAEIVKLVGDTHEMQLVSVFQPYIIDNLDYTLMLQEARGLPMIVGIDPDRILAALHTTEFQNVAAVKWDIATDLRGLLLNALFEARAAEALLSEEYEKGSVTRK
jgi:uncharacterized protein YlxW (UPF0749 family)